MAFIQRTRYLDAVKKSLKTSKVTALLGPRQIGKTTLARQIAKLYKKEKVHFFDLEDPTDFTLLENPKLTLESLEGLIILDEIQRKPDLFLYLRVKSDQMKANTRILILGSSSRDLIESASESLAGRIRYIEIQGLSIQETRSMDKQFVRGSLPKSYTAKNDSESYLWRRDYSQAYVERDLRKLGIDLPAQSLRRFIEMLAGYHGNVFNLSEIGKSMGFSHTTARKYLDILVSTFLFRELKPWNEQIIQRQVKQPKVYFRDSGLLNYFLGIKSKTELRRYAKLGSLWEGFALEEVIKITEAEPEDLYFWALHQQGELDLLWMNKGRRIGFEVKYSDSPQVTSSMMKAMTLLNLHHLYIIYPGSKRSLLAPSITLLPLEQISEQSWR